MKPANILLTKDNGTVIKIADFGVAVRKTKYEHVHRIPYVFRPRSVTSKNRSERLWRHSCSSDMWSVGVIMFNLLCAHNPWTASEFEKPSRTLHSILIRRLREKSAMLRRICQLWNPDHEARLEAKDASPPLAADTKEIIQGESAGLPLPQSCPMLETELRRGSARVVIWVVTRRR